MKVFKFNESVRRIKKYYLIPTDDRFYQSLKTIQYPKDLIPRLESLRKEHKYLFIDYDGEYWEWSKYSDDFVNFYEIGGYKFMGAINIPEYELSSKKYNL